LKSNSLIRCFSLFSFLIITRTCLGQDSIWLARTHGKFPFLEYGIGDERLGGAKMGFLDTNVLLKVVDSFATDYKVRLSSAHTAYIAKESVRLIRKEANGRTVHNPLLTGSMKAFGEGNADFLAVSLPETLPYKSYQQIGPSAIIVEIFGVNSNTNWLAQMKSVKEIRNTWCEQPEDDLFRIHIELRHTQHWGHSIYYDSTGKRMIIKIKRQPSVMDIRKMRIAIDAGHGGDNNGTAGIVHGVQEKIYTLTIAKELEKDIKKTGANQVFMTRTKDTSLSMTERLEMVKTFDPDFLVSIHLNSGASDTTQGVSTYYRYIGFRPLSVFILNQMLSLGLKEFGNIGQFNFALNGPTDYPNALVEVAFLSNAADEKKVNNPKFQKAVAQKIFLGIQDWLRSLK
jgi:N-acetylmuramoyl-L-alanine amidase